MIFLKFYCLLFTLIKHILQFVSNKRKIFIKFLFSEIIMKFFLKFKYGFIEISVFYYFEKY